MTSSSSKVNYSDSNSDSDENEFCQSCYGTEAVDGLFCEDCTRERDPNSCWCHYENGCENCRGVPPDRMMICETCMQESHGENLLGMPLEKVLGIDMPLYEDDKHNEASDNGEEPKFEPEPASSWRDLTPVDMNQTVTIEQGGKYGSWYIPVGAKVPTKIMDMV